MKRQKIAVVAFSLLLLIATILGCGTPGTNFLIPTGGNQFAFVVNAEPDNSVSGLTISAFALDSTTGNLTAVPNSPFMVTAVSGSANIFIDVDPSGHFLFAPTRNADSVSVFSIGSNGALTPVGSPAPTNGSDAFAVKVHPTGKYLYVANQSSDDITVFSIGATGTLTQVGDPVPADGDVHHLFMDPKGRFLYAGIWGEGYAVDIYTISPTDGSLTYVDYALTGNTPQSGTVDAAGKFLLVANKYGNDVTVFQIDQTTGDLTEVTGVGSPFATGKYPFHVVEFVLGTTTYMAVNNVSGDTISVYTFDTATGQLTLDGAPSDLGGLNHPSYMAADASGRFGYVTDGGNDRIIGMTLSATGEPTPIANSPFTTGGLSNPVQIVVAEQQ